MGLLLLLCLPLALHAQPAKRRVQPAQAGTPSAGKGATADVVSRSVAKDDSLQRFDAKITGNAECRGHTECDSIIMDEGRILAVPGLEANHVDAALVHEAAIGKIAGEQLLKLMTLGLTSAEAEEQIINGFLQ